MTVVTLSCNYIGSMLDHYYAELWSIVCKGLIGKMPCEFSFLFVYLCDPCRQNSVKLAMEQYQT